MTNLRPEGDIEHELEMVRREADAGVHGAGARHAALQSELDARSACGGRVPAPQSGKAPKPTLADIAEDDAALAVLVAAEATVQHIDGEWVAAIPPDPDTEPEPAAVPAELPPPPAEKFHATHPDSVIIDSVPPAEAVKPTRRPRKS